MTILLILIVAAVIAGAGIFWGVWTQRGLVALDETINHSMNQIGVQLSSQCDAMIALLGVAGAYAKYESETLVEMVKRDRSIITAKSSPDEVRYQEDIIMEALGRIALISERYPQMMADEGYRRNLDAVETFGNMVRISILIYNDNVARMNREIRMFPVSLIAGALGFFQRDYLESRKTRRVYRDA